MFYHLRSDIGFPDWDPDMGTVIVQGCRICKRSPCTCQNDETWTKIEPRYRTYSDHGYFIPVKLSDTSIALIITGFPYPTDPPLLSIIILGKGTAKLVFNKEMGINSNKNSYLFLYDNTV